FFFPSLFFLLLLLSLPTHVLAPCSRALPVLPAHALSVRERGGRRALLLLGPSLPSNLIKNPLYVPFKEKPLLFYLFSELVPTPYKQNFKYTPAPFQSNPCISRNYNQALAISKIITKRPLNPV